MEGDLRPLVETGELIVLPVMTGSVVFLADLMRHLQLRFRIEPVRARSYVGQTTTATQAVALEGVDEDRLRGSHILIVDDVLDSGRTISRLRDVAKAAGATSVSVCVLLRKENAPDVPCDYVGFDIPDAFVVGYGLDYDGWYRNLPDIGVLRPEIYGG
jgi:hypoxanthine phosphoribosyltransferase